MKLPSRAARVSILSALATAVLSSSFLRGHILRLAPRVLRRSPRTLKALFFVGTLLWSMRTRKSAAVSAAS